MSLSQSGPRAVHTHEQFEFVADAPIEVVWMSGPEWGRQINSHLESRDGESK